MSRMPSKQEIAREWLSKQIVEDRNGPPLILVEGLQKQLVEAINIDPAEVPFFIEHLVEQGMVKARPGTGRGRIRDSQVILVDRT